MSSLHSETTIEIAKALNKVQAEALTALASNTVRVETKSGGHFSYNYADLSGIWAVCRERLAENGLAISQLLHITDHGYQSLVTMLLHESGEWLSSEIKVEPSQQNDPQALGSAITYARRYALTAIVGITVEDEDDDGAAASKKAQPNRQPKAPQENGEIGNVSEFLNRAMKTFGYKNSTEICEALGCAKPVDIITKYETFDKAGTYLESLQGNN